MGQGTGTVTRHERDSLALDLMLVVERRYEAWLREQVRPYDGIAMSALAEAMVRTFMSAYQADRGERAPIVAVLAFAMAVPEGLTSTIADLYGLADLTPAEKEALIKRELARLDRAGPH